MTHLGLFAGIGGFELAAKEVGWQTVAWCEIDNFCQMVLEDLFPEAEKLTDIKTTDFKKYANQIDIITGGFPCQPYSVAGKREGDKSDKHLWPQMLRAIREVRPPWVVGENVPGLINWSTGVVFEQVQTELEAEGYEVQTYVLPACGVGAPHQRYRVWIVAYRGSFHSPVPILERGQVKKTNPNITGKNESRNVTDTPNIGQKQSGDSRSGRTGFKNGSINATNPEKQGCKGSNPKGSTSKGGRNMQHPGFDRFPTQSPVCSGDDGLFTQSLRQRIRENSNGIITEKEIDKILSKAATTFRNESIKAYGNAIVHQVAVQIFKAITQYDQNCRPRE